ncbi:MAG TPA: DUF4177 domain-containing protein [Thermodesulfobacteriota bacterium]|nr:DUF4177 domain-containing protein [Deltaproteobacteria bacterium]HNR14708.1 DUF4177 domain-containing protein [Thermodesulfobacteriota bacterium]HNU70480.1 DUF4177 domain-containing protein [Thermodesulfobacteriota bacterium]HOC39701.1 DUF4177 domain-containing protein [Thermodesulfobacteriota bacterium]HQO77002.1 DUF4177 domain-containing protein [Thermodesulfobacteriota bacterium]
MDTFEYEISTYSAKAFQRLVFFCSEAGECSVNEVTVQDTAALKDILNRQGADGWELVQISFSHDGAVAFWKRLRQQNA